MLKYLRQFRHIETSTANVDTSKMPLLEVFIHQFLSSVNVLIKQGLRSDYTKQLDNLPFKKGKLLTVHQLRHNLTNKQRFFVEFDEYTLDRPVNRLLHSALNKVNRYITSHQNKKLARELMLLFQGVPLSSNLKCDFNAIRIDRGMGAYQQPIAWARLILEGLSPLSMRGEAYALSLLFPMEAVFESFVAKTLRNQLNDEFELKEQAQNEKLVAHGKDQYFQLKPDLLIKDATTNIAVLDTKWKVIEPSKSNGTDKYGLSQSDFYQMFAYGHKYLKPNGSEGESKELFLVYPAHDGFRTAIPVSFDFNSELRLWVVPFKIGLSVKDCKLMLPKNSDALLWYQRKYGLEEDS